MTITPDNDRQGEMLSQVIMRRGTNGQRVVLAHSDPSHLANSQDRAVDKMTIHKEAFACIKVKNTTIIKNLFAKEIKYHSTIVPQARHLNLNESMWQACPFQLLSVFFGDYQQCLNLAAAASVWQNITRCLASHYTELPGLCT